MWGWCPNTSSSLARPGSVSGTCPCCALCPEPQQHAPSPCYSFPPVGPCACTHYLLGHVTTCPGTPTSPGPQPSARCLSVGVGRSLALGSPDSGFPGHCGLRPAGACIPVNVPSPHFPCLSPPLPARTQQGESSSRAPCQAADPQPPGMGRAPVSDPWEPGLPGHHHTARASKGPGPPRPHQ